MSKVFLIVSGRHSDFEVHAAYTHEDVAKRIAKTLSGKCNVFWEPYGVVGVSLDEEPQVAPIYEVEIDAETGEECAEERCHWIPRPWSEEETDTAWHLVRAGTIRGRSTRGYDVALKAARDKRTLILAEQAGV